MKNYFYFLVFILASTLTSCIGDDIINDRVDPVVRITNPIDTIEINTSYQFQASYFNNVGQMESTNLSWASSDESTISIDGNGNATANQIGNSMISVEAMTSDGDIVREEQLLTVGNSTVVTSNERSGTLQTTSSYALGGDFVLKEDGGSLVLSFAENYNASTALPGLYIYLTNNPNTTSGALELGKVTTFSGVHSYDIPNTVALMDYEYVLYFCKPFNVKVGDGQFTN